MFACKLGVCNCNNKGSKSALAGQMLEKSCEHARGYIGGQNFTKVIYSLSLYARYEPSKSSGEQLGVNVVLLLCLTAVLFDLLIYY